MSVCVGTPAVWTHMDEHTSIFEYMCACACLYKHTHALNMVKCMVPHECDRVPPCACVCVHAHVNIGMTTAYARVHQCVHAPWLSVSTSTRVCDSAFPHMCARMWARLLHEHVCIGVSTCRGGSVHVCVRSQEGVGLPTCASPAILQAACSTSPRG